MEEWSVETALQGVRVCVCVCVYVASSSTNGAE